jgi:glutathione S-transferase
MQQLPILYSFVRCPYAMRARIALLLAKQSVILREVSLKSKPAEMLAISAKATVPVMQLIDGSVLEQSRDIMQWAMNQHDPYGLLSAPQQECDNLLDENDTFFKTNLDRYKYPQRFNTEVDEHVCIQARTEAEKFLVQLDTRLQHSKFLISNQISLADIGILPFVRQFAAVDQNWFNSRPYPALQRWLSTWLQTAHFQEAMQKFKPWQEGDANIIIPIKLPDDARCPFLYNAE